MDGGRWRPIAKDANDDKDKTSQVQAERIRGQRWRGDSLEALTVDRVFRARGKMMKIKANGPRDCLVTEMLQKFHIPFGIPYGA